MRHARVVITGMGAVSPYGQGVRALWDGVHSNRCSLTALPPAASSWGGCHVVGRVPPLQEKAIPRELRRCMSPMSIFACLAAWEALAQAGLANGQGMGTALGSTLGSPTVLHDFFADLLRDHDTNSTRSTTFFKIMGHTVAANVAHACQCTGRLLAPAAACASGLMAVCLGYEAIATGREQRMLCGGADELHPLVSATFDKLGAASHEVDPEGASRPFDTKRTGVVCGEGAGVLVLESLESAQARGAHIWGEVCGSSMTTSTAHLAQPDTATMVTGMAAALKDAGIHPADVAYVNAHATATEYGDIAEGQAIATLFGERTPVSSLKGHLGHTMAASGALESILCLAMLHLSVAFPTYGLHTPDARCGNIRHITTAPVRLRGPILKNNFALGGCNCSLVLDSFHERRSSLTPVPL